MKKSIVACLLLAAVATPAHAQFASTACAPPLSPVPLFGPPNWWSNLGGSDFYKLINDPFDPRWAGGAKQDFAFGANPHITLRVGSASDTQTPGPGLDLQWTVWVDPASGQSPNEGLWVALTDKVPFDGTAGTGSNSGILHLSLSQTTSATTEAPHPVAAIRYFYALAGSTTWVERTDAGGAAKPPTWAVTTSRQWLPVTAAAAPYVWVISMRIPIASAGTFDNPDNGLNLGASFGLAHEVDVGDTATPVIYDWPRQIGLSNPTSTPDNGWPTSWGTVNNNTSACQGISINPGDLSTDYVDSTGADDHAFHRSADNTLHAKPHNNTGADVAGVTAKFRVADWGSQIGSFNPADTPWLEVGTSAAGTIPGSGAMQGDLSFVWPAGATNYWTQKDSMGNYTHLDHQCIYVELRSAATNVLLSPDSAWTNMHFGPASTFKEDARVSIKGLPSPVANTLRDVYLYFEKMNMNALSPPRSLPPPVTVTPNPDVRKPTANDNNNNAKQAVTLQPSVPLTQLELDNFKKPSYRVHVYHDTGRSYTTADGKKHRVLEAQGDYGWFINHKGADDKTLWTAETVLNPAQRSPGASTTIDKIRADWWRLGLDPGGFVTLTTTITASDRHWHWWWLIVILFLVIILVARRK